MLDKLGYKQSLLKASINMGEAFALDGFIFNMYIWLSLATQHTMGVLDQSVMTWLKNNGKDYWREEEEGFLYDLEECEEELSQFFKYIKLEDRYVFLPVYKFYMEEQLKLIVKGMNNEAV